MRWFVVSEVNSVGIQMNDRNILVLNSDEVHTLLAGNERELIEIVRRAYIAHWRGDSSVPESCFLRFPGCDRNRIIALPAFLGSEFGVAGIKWISSFPANIENGTDRASAIIVLNSVADGRPDTILEGSLISAKRTAASAALAADTLVHDKNLSHASVIGCGLINFEIIRFLLAVFRRVEHLTLFDVDPARARSFAAKVQSELSEIDVKVSRTRDAALASSRLVSIATTATQPHIHDLSMCASGATILHVSLRDLAPDVILKCYNVVDDVDHICRAQTSIQLAEEVIGRKVAKTALAQLILNEADESCPPDTITVFSPFGLGILDLALAAAVRDAARSTGLGTILSDFLPAPWRQQQHCRVA